MPICSYSNSYLQQNYRKRTWKFGKFKVLRNLGSGFLPTYQGRHRHRLYANSYRQIVFETVEKVKIQV